MILVYLLSALLRLSVTTDSLLADLLFTDHFVTYQNVALRNEFHFVALFEFGKIFFVKHKNFPLEILVFILVPLNKNKRFENN